MPRESQESAQLKEQFLKITDEQDLRAFESANREKINESSLSIRDMFDKKWKEVTGKSYYQPVTTVPVSLPTDGQNITRRSNPKKNKYLARITFSKIHWQKLPRRRIGKKFKDLYNLKGTENGTDDLRPIYNNVDAEQLKSLVGIKDRDNILESAKKTDHGEIKGSFTIDVEGYWRVVFAPQREANDTKDVQLMWEGQCLLGQRMKEIVVPGFYLEVADNTMLDRFTQEPGEGRKLVGTIQRYPYTVIEESNRAEYLKEKSAGDLIQREALMREEVK